LERCQKSPAIFDNEKLRWMNGVYIRGLSGAELAKRVWPFLVEAGLVGQDAPAETRDFLSKAILLEQEKMTVLSEAPGLVDFFLADEVVFDPESVEKVLKKEGARDVLKGINAGFEALPVLTAENTEKACRDFAAAKGLKNGQVFHPVRVSVSGRTKGPSLFHMLEVMGKDMVRKRITLAIDKLAAAAI
jgi:glutamyl/glutaminyl-tRNA synthetase